jgi:nicotinamidase/pyrazinamidase
MSKRTSYDEATALVVVDVQNDFAHPDGGLYVRGGEEIIPAVNDEIGEARSAGGLVVYTQDWHPETTPHFQKDGGIWPTHCVQGTWGAELHTDLDVVGPVLQKGTGGEDGYSGFTVQHPVNGETAPTGLDALLRERDIRRLVVVGLAQDVCVKETVLEALGLGYQVTVPREATRPVNLRPGNGDAALRSMSVSGARLV